MLSVFADTLRKPNDFPSESAKSVLEGKNLAIRSSISSAAKQSRCVEHPCSSGPLHQAIEFDMRIVPESGIFAAEARMNTTRSNKEDLVFYVLSALAAAWALVCVVGLLMRAK
jgi:hypothetical protein